MIDYFYDSDMVYTKQCESVPDVGNPDKYLKRRNSTNVAVPEAEEGYTYTFDKTTEKWTKVEDHRGKVKYNCSSKIAARITTVGPIGDGYTLDAPTQWDEWDEDTEAWSEDTTTKTQYHIDILRNSVHQYQADKMKDPNGNGYAYLLNFQDPALFPKSVAIVAWVKALWIEYYVCKEKIRNGQFDAVMDFESLGDLLSFEDAKIEIETVLAQQ